MSLELWKIHDGQREYDSTRETGESMIWSGDFLCVSCVKYRAGLSLPPQSFIRSSCRPSYHSSWTKALASRISLFESSRQIVNRKLGSSSKIHSPRSACAFFFLNHHVMIATVIITRTLHLCIYVSQLCSPTLSLRMIKLKSSTYAIQVANPGTNNGPSSVLKINAPATPPIPPIPVKLAEQNALLHWPRILFAWYAITLGIALFVPATVTKIPKYCTQGFLTKPMIGKPISETRHKKHRTGPRVFLRSEYQAARYMMTAEAT